MPRSSRPETTRRQSLMSGLVLLSLLVSLGVLETGCMSRQSTQSLRKQVEELQRENFQLRKDLTEQRVRLEIQNEPAFRPAAPASSTRVPDRETPLPAKSESDVPRVIYSEPITDASKYTAGSRSASPVPAAKLMRTAREKLDAKDPAGALVIFQQIVATSPEDALADDAQFGAGECYFQMGKFEEAINEYMKVVNNFPFGDQVPSAFLKIGFAHLAREERGLALDNFKTVSEAYPGTEAATVARQQIAHLSAAGR